jgi:hypothetical protein
VSASAKNISAPWHSPRVMQSAGSRIWPFPVLVSRIVMGVEGVRILIYSVPGSSGTASHLPHQWAGLTTIGR